MKKQITVETEITVYRLGSAFHIVTPDGLDEKLMICQTGSNVFQAISLETGNRWNGQSTKIDKDDLYYAEEGTYWFTLEQVKEIVECDDYYTGVEYIEDILEE